MIYLAAPGSQLMYTFDWAEDLESGIELVDVAYDVPPPLLVLDAEVDVVSGMSTILVEVPSDAHAQLYQINALAQLSSNEKAPGSFTLRVCAGT